MNFLFMQISLYSNKDSVELVSLLKLKERVTRTLKWEQGYNWKG